MGSEEIERANIDRKPVCDRYRCRSLSKGYPMKFVFADWKKSESKMARHSLLDTKETVTASG